MGARRGSLREHLDRDARRRCHGRGDRHRCARQPRRSRRLGASRHRLRRRHRRSHRPRRPRHARRRHHRRARQQRRWHRGRGAGREDPPGARARRERFRRFVERRARHHLGRRSRRAGDQPEPRRRSVARHPDRDAVRALEAGRRGRRRRGTIINRATRRCIPAAYPEAIAVAAINKNRQHAVVLEHRWLRRHRGARRLDLVGVGIRSDAVRLGERNLDGDAVCRGRGRAGDRRQQEPRRAAQVTSLLESKRDRPRRRPGATTCSDTDS